MSRRRRREEPPENHERWLVSYADFITLLFAFFVVMYSISSINEGKYRVLSDTLVAAFKTAPRSPTPINVGETAAAAPALTRAATPDLLRLKPPAASAGAADMATISRRVEAALQPLIESRLVNVTRNKLWVKVELNSRLLFASGSALIQEQARAPLQELAGVLRDLPNHVDVEGHTDDVPIHTEVFPSNWELSAARAASVVRLFIAAGVDPRRLAAIGFGPHRPLADNATPEGRARNRRVAVVILAHRDARRVVAVEGDGEG